MCSCIVCNCVSITERAKTDMDYKPVVPMDKAIELAIESFPELKKKT